METKKGAKKRSDIVKKTKKATSSSKSKKTVKHAHQKKTVKSHSSSHSKTHSKEGRSRAHATHSNHKKPNHSFIEKILKVEHELPLGIRVLTVYLFLLAVFYLIVGVSFRKAMIFGVYVDGLLAFVINALTILVICSMIYGFAKKKIQYYYVSTVFFVLVIMNTLTSIFTLRLYTTGVLRDLINYSFALVLLLNVSTIIFILSKKYYFLHPKPEYHVSSTDKLFVIGLTIMWIFLMGGILYYGNAFLDQSFAEVDVLVEDLYERSVLETVNYCGYSSNRDLCFYVGAIINKDDPNAKLLCDYVNLPYFHNDCLKSVSE
ncbi:hypothetical protein BVX95_01095 [archaeon D22]|nr:hypothetical protein BVX95_01095 [archaeon D22]